MGFLHPPRAPIFRLVFVVVFVPDFVLDFVIDSIIFFVIDSIIFCVIDSIIAKILSMIASPECKLGSEMDAIVVMFFFGFTILAEHAYPYQNT